MEEKQQDIDKEIKMIDKDELNSLINSLKKNFLSEKGVTTIEEPDFNGYGESTSPQGHDYIDRVFTKDKVYFKRDVKEFIEKENELLDNLHKKEISWSEFTRERKKLLGHELIKIEKKELLELIKIEKKKKKILEDKNDR